ncbi:MAG: S-adenosylmethionine:tRNA ribosyltransferase-isomerase, partial [Eggerthellaceae bacterium]|nr:S-adenosylmethionine:tRNA ribosyltransferase-isomerase [Eggerthellaceae bacterium]
MKTEDFNYDLPPELIAQSPKEIRDECRLLVMDRKTGALEDRLFKEIVDYVREGDVLIANENRVMPARLLGHKRFTCAA